MITGLTRRAAVRRHGPSRRAGFVLLAVVMVVPVAGVQAISMRGARADVAITQYSDPTISQPTGLAVGPDGALWFTNRGGSNASIGRITTAGAVTNFTDPGVIVNPWDIAAGSDGALWFANGTSIGRITTTGVVTVFTDPAITGPVAITAGPDGAMWFTNNSASNNSSIGRITTAGVVTTFTDPAVSSSNMNAITTGSDGALWVTAISNFGGSIERITTAGAITDYPDPGTSPFGITSGPDGALWYATDIHSIGRITTGGTIKIYTDPKISGADAITAGPDGALWFSDTALGVDSIGRITTSGTVTDFDYPNEGFVPNLVAGPDGGVWFANSSANTIGRVTPPTSVPCGSACADVVATPGVPVASSSGPPTDAHPTKEVITLPKQAGANPVDIKLQSITPGPKLSAADKLLCPTAGNKCSGQIAVFAGDFSQYTNRAHPIQVQVIAKWKTKVGPGKLLMAKDMGGPPVQLARCVARGGKYNTPCLKSEIITGSAAKKNLITTSTILFVGTDPRFARHVATGPDAPTAVKATAGAGKATVQWTAPVVTNGTITNYTITPHLGKVAQKSVSVAGTARRATITGLKKGKSYTFTIVAKTARGVSLASKASNAIKPA